MAPPDRLRGGSSAGTGGARRGAKTAGATPTTGCVTPPGGVGVKRRREIYPRRAPSLRFGGAPAERGEKSPDFGPRDQIVVVSEGRSASRVDFSASLHSHTTWGGDTAGGWGRTRGLGPAAGPNGTRGGPARAAPRGHVCKLYLTLNFT